MSNIKDKPCIKCNEVGKTLVYVKADYYKGIKGCNLPSTYYKIGAGDAYYHCYKEHIITTCATCGFTDYTSVIAPEC